MILRRLLWTTYLAIACTCFGQAGWQTHFIDKPQFFLEPLPSQYQGKSVPELQALGYQNINLPALTATNFRWADGADADTLGDLPSTISSELRGHPLLDKLILELNQDPIALAAFVQNEIKLTNALQAASDLVDETYVIQADQIMRGALGTYLERQGSPWEQCALLVHLLRRAGYPAAYVYNTNVGNKRGVWMFARDVQAMLGVHLKNDTPEGAMIHVSFPWVAVYTTKTGTGGEWKQLFPWIKDTAIEEGLNHYDYLPSGYASGRDWFEKYLTNDAEINEHISDGISDSPGELFLSYINSKTASYGLSVEDFGIRKYLRKKQISTWSDFPRPFIIGQNDSTTWTGTLSVKANDLRDAGDSSKFATLQLSIQTVSGGTNQISTQAMRLCDLHNRRFYAFYKPGENKIALELSPFDDDASLTAGNFSTTTIIARQYREVTNPGVPLQLRIDIAGLNTSVNFTGAEFTRPFELNSLTAICFNAGNVTRDMLDVHARKFQKLEGLTTTPPAQDYVGVTMYMTGMSYWANMLKELQDIRDLHKIYTYFDYGLCLASITPEGGSGSQWRIPKVDIPFKINLLQNSSTRPYSGQTQADIQKDDYFLEAGVSSAHEHQVLNKFFGRENAISTIKLLRLSNDRHAQTAGNGNRGFFAFTRSEFAAAHTDPAYAALRAQAGPMWTAAYSALQIGVGSYVPSGWERVYVTPFDIAMDAPGSTPAYTGMGLMYVMPAKIGALIDGQASGAVGEFFEYDIFGASNFSNLSMSFNLDGGYELIDFSELDIGSLVASLSTLDIGFYLNRITSGNLFVDSFTGTSWTVGSAQLGFGTPSDLGVAGGNLYSNGWLGGTSWHNFGGSGNSFVSDPVNVVTGEFYIDAVDLTLPGPFPLEIRRNYGSQNEALNILGYGWKFSLTPYINITQDSSVAYVADPDGSVVAYRKVLGSSPERWEPTAADNPLLNNYNGGKIGAQNNPFNAYVLKTTETTNTIYTLYKPSGNTARYRVRSFPVVSNGTTYSRQRPYLEKWSDTFGNHFTFSYFETASDIEYGQLRRITSTNGSYLGFRYGASGLVTEIFTHDGRRVAYTYDKFGDLIEVTLPDNSKINYAYEIRTDAQHDDEPYSTHLLTEERKPDGRVLRNVYDPVYDPAHATNSAVIYRRVTEQWGTVGIDLVPIKFAEFEYNPSGDAWVSAGYDVTYVHSDVRPSKGRLTTTYVHKEGLYHYIADPFAVGFSPSNVAIEHVLANEWYAPGETNGYQRSVKAVTDKRGLVMRYEYDAKGSIRKLTREGDLVGDGSTSAVSTYYYYDSAKYNLRKVIEPSPGSGLAQKVIYYTYPIIAGGANSIIDPVNSNYYLYAYLPQKTSVYSVLSPALNDLEPSLSDKVSEVAHAYGREVAGGLEAHGLLKKVASSSPIDTDDKTEITVQYNSAGYPTARTQKTFTSTPDVVMLFEHNLKGELVKETDPSGRFWRYEYDMLGRIKSKARYASASAPAAVDWNLTYYNQNGEVTWLDGARHFPEDYIFNDYDGAGRVIAQVRWRSQAKADGTGVEAVPGQGDFLGQSITYFEHDGFGNMVSKIDPSGNEALMVYDALGQLESQVVAVGTADEAQETYEYEAGGLVSSHVNFKGGETITSYTDAGQPAFRSTPDGRVEEWRYYLDGRLKTHTLSNQATWNIAYDDKLLKVTRTLVKDGVTLAKEVKSFDARGNEIRREEFESATISYVFENEYDGLNRLTRKAGPPAKNHPNTAETVSSQQVTTYAYAYGNVSTPYTIESVTGNIKRVEVYNSADQLGLSLLINTTNSKTEDETSYSYADTVNVVISKRVFRYSNGAAADTMVTEYYSDNDGNPVLTRFADGKFIRNVYDKSGNLIESHDELSLKTEYEYDNRNRQDVIRKADNSVISLGYDDAGNITSRSMPGSLEWQAQYDDADRMEWEQLVGSDSSVSRRIEYAYHPSGENVGLLYQKKENPGYSDSVVHSYSYDGMMRVTSIHSAGGGYPAVTQSRSYDWRGIVTSLTRGSPTHASLVPSVRVAQKTDGYSQIYDQVTQVGTGVGESGFTSKGTEAHLIQRWNASGQRTTLRKGPTVAAKGSWEPWFIASYFAGGQPRQIYPNALSNVFALDYFWTTTGLLEQYGLAVYGPTLPYYVKVTDTFAPPYSNPQHDARGRLVGREMYAQIGGVGVSPLIESFPRAFDGKLLSYSVQHTTGTGISWATHSETRDYTYNPQNRRLASESFKPNPVGASPMETLNYEFDGDNLGVRVKTNNVTENSPEWEVPDYSAGGLDSFKRISTEVEESELTSFLAVGSTVGPGKFKLQLGKGASPTAWTDLATVHPQPGYGSGSWSVPLTLPPGQYTLKANAEHVWSGSSFGTSQTSTFTVGTAGQQRQRSNVYDRAGRLISRTWASGQAVQTFIWDATGQLVRVEQEDQRTSGRQHPNYVWTAVYDPMGRRISTSYVDENSREFNPEKNVIKSWYDPQVEFLEVAVESAGTRWWKVHGPDLTSGYGAHQGVGGLEVIVNEATQAYYPVIDDAFGNVVAYINLGSVTDPNDDTLVWVETQVGAYGPLPGHQMQPLENTKDILKSLAWQSKRIDPTGFIHMGARYYDPVSGSFISTDPLGHAECPDLYSYANGDPVNHNDPTGRGAQLNFNISSAVNPIGDFSWLGQSEGFTSVAGSYGETPSIGIDLNSIAGKAFSQALDYAVEDFDMAFAARLAVLAREAGDTELERVAVRMLMGEYNAQTSTILTKAGLYFLAGSGGLRPGTPSLSMSGNLVDDALVAELKASGIKITPQNVVATSRNAAGQIVFLETGSAASGLQHIILAHADDFARIGVSQSEIPAVVTRAVTQGRFVGYQGTSTGRPIYEITINGQVRHIAVTVGDNGYIVGANPASLP